MQVIRETVNAPGCVTSVFHPSRFLGLRFACGGAFVSGFGLGMLPSAPARGETRQKVLPRSPNFGETRLGV